jgi:hypothetical protein
LGYPSDHWAPYPGATMDIYDAISRLSYDNALKITMIN